MSHLAFLSATELAGKILDKEISSLELTDHFINRIEQLDDGINAVVVRDFDRALAAASKADRQLAMGEITGPLHGVPVTVKDHFINRIEQLDDGINAVVVRDFDRALQRQIDSLLWVR